MKQDQKYIPGVCNIGPAEMTKRRQAGRMGIVTTIILGFTLIAIGAPRAWRLTVSVPIAAAAVGYLQNSFHFCVAFGLRGLYNVINSAGVTEDITNSEYREKDRRKSIIILSLSATIGLVGGILFLMI